MIAETEKKKKNSSWSSWIYHKPDDLVYNLFYTFTPVKYHMHYIFSTYTMKKYDILAK